MMAKLDKVVKSPKKAVFVILSLIISVGWRGFIQRFRLFTVPSIMDVRVFRFRWKKPLGSPG
jgi:hypothetical protein